MSRKKGSRKDAKAQLPYFVFKTAEREFCELHAVPCLGPITSDAF